MSYLHIRRVYGEALEEREREIERKVPVCSTTTGTRPRVVSVYITRESGDTVPCRMTLPLAVATRLHWENRGCATCVRAIVKHRDFKMQGLLVNKDTNRP